MIQAHLRSFLLNLSYTLHFIAVFMRHKHQSNFCFPFIHSISLSPYEPELCLAVVQCAVLPQQSKRIKKKKCGRVFAETITACKFFQHVYQNLTCYINITPEQTKIPKPWVLPTQDVAYINSEWQHSQKAFFFFRFQGCT